MPTGAAISSEGSPGAGGSAELTQVIVGRIYFLKTVDLRPSVLCCWLETLLVPYLGPPQRELTTWQLTSSEGIGERAKENVTKMEVTVLVLPQFQK